MERLRNLKRRKEKIGNLETLFFPPMCGICGKLNEKYLCGRCNIELQKMAEFNISNESTIQNFDEHMYFFKYDGLIRKQIIDYKFNEAAYKYKMLTNFILENFILKRESIFQIVNDYDIIIPVPISKKRMEERGYNQSELIAKEIAKWMHKEANTKCLCKPKEIIAQSSLNKEQRKINIKNAYTLKSPQKIFNKKILLLDDIYTTGSTVNECSVTLQEAKPKKIGVMTIAKD